MLHIADAVDRLVNGEVGVAEDVCAAPQNASPLAIGGGVQLVKLAAEGVGAFKVGEPGIAAVELGPRQEMTE